MQTVVRPQSREAPMKPGEANSKQLLLISNSIQHGRGFLDHVEPEMRDFLRADRRLLFVPFAFFDRDAYADRVRTRMEAIGCALESLHRVPDPERAVESAEAVFVGGGNTFRLLKCLH